MTDTRLLEERGGVRFGDCLRASTQSKLLVQQWERLSGKKLVAGNPLHRMIDEATGYNAVPMRAFADFVYRYVFSTLPEVGV
jgi:hypothetical protein